MAYGYNPSQFVPDYGDIATAGQQVAGGILGATDAIKRYQNNMEAKQLLYGSIEQGAIEAYKQANPGVNDAQARAFIHKRLHGPTRGETLEQLTTRLKEEFETVKSSVTAQAGQQQRTALQTAMTGIERTDQPVTPGVSRPQVGLVSEEDTGEFVHQAQPAQYREEVAERAGQMPPAQLGGATPADIAGASGLPRQPTPTKAPSDLAYKKFGLEQEKLEQRRSEQEQRRLLEEAKLRVRRYESAVKQKNDVAKSKYTTDKISDDYRLYSSETSKLEMKKEMLINPPIGASIKKALKADNPVIVALDAEIAQNNEIKKALKKAWIEQAKSEGLKGLQTGLESAFPEEAGDAPILSEGSAITDDAAIAEIKKDPGLWAQYNSASSQDKARYLQKVKDYMANY